MKKIAWEKMLPLGLMMVASLTACSRGEGERVEEETVNGIDGVGRMIESPWSEEEWVTSDTDVKEPVDVYDPMKYDGDIWDTKAQETEMDRAVDEARHGWDDMMGEVDHATEGVKEGWEHMMDDFHLNREEERDVYEGVRPSTTLPDLNMDTKDGGSDPYMGGVESSEVGIDPAFTGVSPSVGMDGGVGLGISSSGGGVLMNLSYGSGGEMEESLPVAGWEEMKGHSRYRATRRGNVYDPSSCEYQIKDLWEEARRSIDEMGDDLSQAMKNIGHDEYHR